MSSANWKCARCGLTNKPVSTTCKACFSVIKEDQITVPATMQALVKERPEAGYELKEVPTPEPGEGEVLVKSFAVGVCGSDIILHNWTKDAETIAKLPFTPGHEAAGLVVKAGPETRMKVGTRVAVENHFFCGECYQCTHKRSDICSNMSQFGHGKGTIHGGCADYFVVRESYCYKLRHQISWRDAALLEPLGVAHNACERLEPRNETVLVQGCGTIGLLAIGVAKAMGAKRVIAADVIPQKLEIAQQMGADIVVNSKTEDLREAVYKITEGVGVGRLLECSGYAPAVNASFALLRKGATIVLVGLPKAPLHVENVLQDVIFKSLQLRTIHGRRIFHTWKQSENLVARKQINLDLVVSHDLPLAKWQEGFEALMSGNAVKVVFDVTRRG